MKINRLQNGSQLLSVANPRSTMQIAKHPIHPMIVPIPITCFVGTLLTDITYWWTEDIMWANFSDWLVTVGVITGFLAAIFGLIDFIGNRDIRAQAPAWPHAIGNIVVLILATINMLVHTRDAWTSVVPWGLTLSALVVLGLLFTGWMGWSMVYRHRVGVADYREGVAENV
jgi:uncharacterized membrane protein